MKFLFILLVVIYMVNCAPLNNVPSTITPASRKWDDSVDVSAAAVVGEETIGPEGQALEGDDNEHTSEVDDNNESVHIINDVHNDSPQVLDISEDGSEGDREETEDNAKIGTFEGGMTHKTDYGSDTQNMEVNKTSSINLTDTSGQVGNISNDQEKQGSGTKSVVKTLQSVSHSATVSNSDVRNTVRNDLDAAGNENGAGGRADISTNKEESIDEGSETEGNIVTSGGERSNETDSHTVVENADAIKLSTTADEAKADAQMGDNSEHAANNIDLVETRNDTVTLEGKSPEEIDSQNAAVSKPSIEADEAHDPMNNFDSGAGKDGDNSKTGNDTGRLKVEASKEFNNSTTLQTVKAAKSNSELNGTKSDDPVDGVSDGKAENGNDIVVTNHSKSVEFESNSVQDPQNEVNPNPDASDATVQISDISNNENRTNKESSLTNGTTRLQSTVSSKPNAEGSETVINGHMNDDQSNSKEMENENVAAGKVPQNSEDNADVVKGNDLEPAKEQVVVTVAQTNETKADGQEISEPYGTDNDGIENGEGNLDVQGDALEENESIGDWKDGDDDDYNTYQNDNGELDKMGKDEDDDYLFYDEKENAVLLKEDERKFTDNEEPGDNDSPPIRFKDYKEEEGGNFFSFILIVMFFTAMLYLLYHNKRKVVAYILPGGQRKTGSRYKGGYKANYERLENKPEGRTYRF